MIGIMEKDMQIGELVQTLIGTIVGGFIVIAANWVTVQEERKKTVQEWYEQTYLTNGVDPLLIYLHSLELHLLDGWIDDISYMQLPKLEPMPIEALTRMQIFLDDTAILASLIGMVHACFNDKKGYARNAALNAVLETYRVLLGVRRELLRVTGSKVRNKNYQIDMKSTRTELAKIFDNFNNEMKIVIKDDKSAPDKK
jgi:hypothetical protein